MSEKRSKYDTDPLDPDFVRRTEELMERTQVSARRPQAAEPEREPSPRAAATEEPTRRFDEQVADSYPSMFVPPVYQPPAQRQGYTSFGADAQPRQQTGAAPPPPGPSSPYEANARPSSRLVQKLGIPENIACILPYAPFYVGLVAAIIGLLIAPRTETRTRFHAAQGMALQLALIIGSVAFSFVEAVTNSGFGGFIFWLASLIFLIVSILRVWNGKPHHIAPLDDATRFLNEKIEPQVK